MSNSDVKKEIVALMDEFHEICLSLSLKYSLSSGSLLGAIRHKGFIPWDDDLDVVMPRKDYDTFISYFAKYQSDRFHLITPETPHYKYSYAKLVSTNTVDRGWAREPKGFGVFIDIFPADKIPDNKRARESYESLVKRQKKYLLFSDFYSYKGSFGFFSVILKTFLFFPRYINSRMKGTLANHQIEYDKICRQYANNDTEEVCFLSTYYGFEKEAFPIRFFDDLKLYPFENREYYGFSKANDYLEKMYGDYMTLPPQNKRISHTQYKFFRKEK